MPFEVVMPRLGWNMEAGRLGEWLKREGEAIEAGQPLLTIESDKAAQEVEALESGTLHIPADSPAAGVEVPVGTLLGYILAPGEAPPAAPAAGRVSPPGVTALAPGASIPSGPAAPAADTAMPAISPRARRAAQELNVDWAVLTGSGRTGRIVERDVRAAALAAAIPAAAKPSEPERVSPIARRMAADLGVDLTALAAQKPGQRIERADVEAAAQARRAAPAAPRSAEPGVITPLSAVRRITAERMAASAHTAAPVTLTTEVDATELMRLRQQFKDDATPPVPTYTDLLVKLSAQALVEFPALNARLEGEGIAQPAAVHIGLAVDTDRGLLVPVVRDVAAKSLRQVARESAGLIEKARAGRLSTDEMQGGTFTITNLGMYGIDAFTPIINLPECAILGVGRMVPKPVVVDVATERVAVRHMCFLSLTFDHRLVDGGPAARFLQRIAGYMARPYVWLAG